MKKKEHRKKLKLNKITIATLDGAVMIAALAGRECPPPMITIEYTCPDDKTPMEPEGESTWGVCAQV